MEAAGEVEERLIDEHKKYVDRVAFHSKSGQPNPPLCKGALIFDEVKVAAKFYWNSRDNKLLGHSMTEHEMSTLSDLYEVEKDPEPKKADYVLQTLWRDFISVFRPGHTRAMPGLLIFYGYFLL